MWSWKTGRYATAGATPFVYDVDTWVDFREDALELVRLRDLRVGAEPAPERLFVEWTVLARDAARALPLDTVAVSPVPEVSAELSSDFILRSVLTEFNEIRLFRFIVKDISRSSEW